MDAVTVVPEPVNEPVRSYAPGSPERASLQARLVELAADEVELSMSIGGEHVFGDDLVPVVQPHRHAAVLGRCANADDKDAAAAVDAALGAAARWRSLPFDDRAAVFLKAADLLAGPWRDTLN